MGSPRAGVTGDPATFGSLAGIGARQPSRPPIPACRHLGAHAGIDSQPVDRASPSAPAERVEVERLGRRAVRRPAEQVALARPDPERADDVELGRRLDPLGDDQRAPAVGQVAQRPDDLERGLADGAALDQRQVDLDDVEAELAEQPQPGVAGADVVGGDAACRRPGRPRRRGAAGRCPRPPRARSARGRRGAGPAPWRTIIRSSAWTLNSSDLQRPRRQVDRQRAGQAQPRGGLHDRVEAGEVELGGPAGRLGGGEHRAGVGEAAVGQRPDQALVAARRRRWSGRRSAGRRPAARRSRRPARRARTARPAGVRPSGHRGVPGRRSSRTSGRGACPSTAPPRPGRRANRGRARGPGMRADAGRERHRVGGARAASPSRQAASSRRTVSWPRVRVGRRQDDRELVATDPERPVRAPQVAGRWSSRPGGGPRRPRRDRPSR